MANGSASVTGVDIESAEEDDDATDVRDGEKAATDTADATDQANTVVSFIFY